MECVTYCLAETLLALHIAFYFNLANQLFRLKIFVCLFLVRWWHQYSLWVHFVPGPSAVSQAVHRNRNIARQGPESCGKLQCYVNHASCGVGNKSISKHLAGKGTVMSYVGFHVPLVPGPKVYKVRGMDKLCLQCTPLTTICLLGSTSCCTDSGRINHTSKGLSLQYLIQR